MLKVIAIIVGVIAVLLVVEWIVSSRKVRPRPLSFIDDSRAVAVGVDNPNDFAGCVFPYQYSPFFQFTVHSDLSWTIWFTAAIYVDRNRDVDLRLMPPIIVCVPRDAHSVSAGPKIKFDVTTGQMMGDIHGQYHSTVERRTSTEKSGVYEIRPLDLTNDRDRSWPMARYEFRCRSKAPNTTSAGLASTHFELLYQPIHAERAGVSPGLGQLRAPVELGNNRLAPVGIQYRPHSDYYGEFDKVELHPELLSQEPISQDLSTHTYKWLIDPKLSFVLQGTATRWVKKQLDRVRIGLLGLIAGGFIGALMALYIR